MPRHNLKPTHHLHHCPTPRKNDQSVAPANAYIDRVYKLYKFLFSGISTRFLLFEVNPIVLIFKSNFDTNSILTVKKVNQLYLGVGNGINY